MYIFYINDTRLPVTPSKLSVKIKNQNKTVNLVDGSEYNILKMPGLSEYSFDVLLPMYEYPFSVYESGFLPPSHFLSLFEDIKVNRRVCALRIIRGDEDMESLPIKCTLEDYTIKEDAGTRDITAALKFKQYEYKKTLILNFTEKNDNTEVTARQDRPVEKEVQTFDHTVAENDTLWHIAKRYYGDGSRWQEIYSANADVIESAAKANGRAGSSNGHWIYPGTVLKIKDGIR